MRKKKTTLMLITILFLFTSAIPGYSGYQVPFVTNTCNTAAMESTTPTGVGYNSTGNLLIVTDSTDDMAYVYDTDCNLHSSFSLPGSSPKGITHNPLEGRYAVTDSISDEVYFLDESGNQLGSCDLSAHGIGSSEGIAFNPVSAHYAVIDNTADLEAVHIIDSTVMDGSACSVLSGGFSLAGIGSDTPSDIAYLSGLDMYAITDGAADEVFAVDTSGTLITRFDTAGFGATSPTGIAFVPSTGMLYITDSSDDLSYEINAGGTSSALCNTGSFGANDITDITYNPATDEMVLVDNVTAAIYIATYDGSVCNQSRKIAIDGFGSTYPTGVAYLPDTNQLALIDRDTDEIYFVGYDTGALESQCDTAALSITSPGGIEYVPHLQLLAVTDTSDDSLYLLDLSCNMIHQNTLSHLPAGNPSDAAFHARTGTFFVSDSSADEVYVLNFEGVQEQRFDTKGLDLTDVTGITPYRGDNEFLLVDASMDEIHVLSLPIFGNTPLTLSGQYSLGGPYPGTLLIFDRGNGIISGIFRDDSYTVSSPVYGHYSSISQIALGAVDPADGRPLVFSCSSTENLSRLHCNGLGTFTRQF